MKKRIISLAIIIILVVLVVYLYQKPTHISIKSSKTVKKTLLKERVINSTAYFTGLNYLYSINIISKIKNTVSGYLGPGKAADSVVKIGIF